MRLSRERPPSGCKPLAILRETKTSSGTRGLCAQQRRWAQLRGLWSCSRRRFLPGCKAIRGPRPGLIETPTRNPLRGEKGFRRTLRRRGAPLAGRCSASGPCHRARRLEEDVAVQRGAPCLARDSPVLVAMLQRPVVPSRRLRDCELGVLGCHQRGRRGAGQRIHRGGSARAAGGLEQHLAAELPGLGAQGGHAPAASGLRPRQARTGRAWHVLLQAGKRLIRGIPRPQGACRHCPLPSPR